MLYLWKLILLQFFIIDLNLDLVIYIDKIKFVVLRNGGKVYEKINDIYILI